MPVSAKTGQGIDALLEQVLECSAIGGPETVRRALVAFVARTGADELMISSMIFDHEARLRSFEIAATAAASQAGRDAARRSTSA